MDNALRKVRPPYINQMQGHLLYQKRTHKCSKAFHHNVNPETRL